MALQREFGGLRIERLAIVKLDARPELDGHRLAVGRSLVRERKLRHDIELLVDVEQLVANRGEHDAPDIGAGERGIEHIRVFGEPDAQRCLSRRHPACQREKCGRRRKAQGLHDGSPSRRRRLNRVRAPRPAHSV